MPSDPVMIGSHVIYLPGLTAALPSSRWQVGDRAAAEAGLRDVRDGK